MKNKFLTIQVWRFLYHMARYKKRKPKPLVRNMTDRVWDNWLTTKKELGL